MDNNLASFYDDRKDVFKEPQSFKGICFYPLKIADYQYIDLFHELFAKPKRYFGLQDPMIFKMSYIKFLLLVLRSKSGYESLEAEQKIIKFFEHITKNKSVDIEYETKGEGLDRLFITLIIEDIRFNENEFDILRAMILRQNGSSLEYVESYNAELEEDLRWMARKRKPFTFSDRVFALASLLRKTIDEVKNCTLYEMEHMLMSLDAIMAYEIQTIPLTEVDSTKYEIASYIAHLEDKERYSGVVVNTEEFKNRSSLFKSNADLAKK